MGLDTSHNAWHGAYSAFMRWRERIAKLTGFPPLQIMESYWPPAPYKNGDIIPDEHLPMTGSRARNSTIMAMNKAGKLPIRWETLSPDACDLRLIPLLNHSDCDGEISAIDCVLIADALTELIPKLNGDGGGHIGSWREKTQQFINGCRAAAAANEPLTFH